MSDGADHDLITRLDERYTSLAKRVEELEAAGGTYATLQHLGRIERIIWVVGSTVVVSVTAGFMAAAGRVAHWIFGSAQ